MHGRKKECMEEGKNAWKKEGMHGRRKECMEEGRNAWKKEEMHGRRKECIEKQNSKKAPFVELEVNEKEQEGEKEAETADEEVCNAQKRVLAANEGGVGERDALAASKRPRRIDCTDISERC